LGMCEVGDIQATKDKLSKLSEQLRSDDGIAIRSNRVYFFVYEYTFTGAELVSWLVAKKISATRPEAEKIGLDLQKYDFIHHIKDKYDFSDSQNLYRFRADDKKVTTASVAEISLSCGAKSGYLLKSGQLLWNKRYCVLRPDEQTLYYFNTKLDSEPRNKIKLNGAVCSIAAEREIKSGTFGFTILSEGVKHILCCADKKDQEDWIELISSCGAEVQETFDPSIIKASLFEYKAFDIHKQLVDMTRYTGKVCLVVNVASQ